MGCELDAVANYHCRCGENPLWDDRRKVVYWTDIPAGRLFRLDPADGSHEAIYSGGVVGGFTLQEDGNLLLFGANRITVFDPDARRERVLAAQVEPGMDRFNDVIADPRGRVFAGTMGRDLRGGLYRADPDATVRCLFRGTNCSNGLAFTPDRRRLYWTDSTARKVHQFDYDPETGDLSNRRDWLALAAGEGTPDGMTVDADGNVWQARWDGWCLCRLAPSGELLERIEFPVAKVSSVVFGGPDLDELYVTTAGGAEGSDSLDGALFRLKVRCRGLPEFRSRVSV